MKHHHFNNDTNDMGQFSTPASFAAEHDPAGSRLVCAFVNDQGDAVRQTFTHDEMAAMADVLLRAMTAYRPGTRAIRPITPGVAAAVAAYRKEMER